MPHVPQNKTPSMNIDRNSNERQTHSPMYNHTYVLNQSVYFRAHPLKLCDETNPSKPSNLPFGRIYPGKVTKNPQTSSETGKKTMFSNNINLRTPKTTYGQINSDPITKTTKNSNADFQLISSPITTYDRKSSENTLSKNNTISTIPVHVAK